MLGLPVGDGAHGVVVVDLHDDCARRNGSRSALPKDVARGIRRRCFRPASPCWNASTCRTPAEVVVDVGHEMRRCDDGRRIHRDVRAVRAQQSLPPACQA